METQKKLACIYSSFIYWRNRFCCLVKNACLEAVKEGEACGCPYSPLGMLTHVLGVREAAFGRIMCYILDLQLTPHWPQLEAVQGLESFNNFFSGSYLLRYNVNWKSGLDLPYLQGTNPHLFADVELAALYWQIPKPPYEVSTFSFLSSTIIRLTALLSIHFSVK